jgi:hypothetical protein
MAYVNNEKKSNIQAALKPIFKKYGLKATVARNSYHSTLIVNITSGSIDFKNVYDDRRVNVYYINQYYDGIARQCLNEILDAIKLSGEWYDESNAQIDYFNTAFYIDINIGKWDKPYVYNAPSHVVQALKELGKLEFIVVGRS